MSGYTEEAEKEGEKKAKRKAHVLSKNEISGQGEDALQHLGNLSGAAGTAYGAVCMPCATKPLLEIKRPEKKILHCGGDTSFHSCTQYQPQQRVATFAGELRGVL